MGHPAQACYVFACTFPLGFVTFSGCSMDGPILVLKGKNEKE
jgi:hypothetical protein